MTTFIACDGSCIQSGNFRLEDQEDRPSAAGISIKMADGRTGTRTAVFADGKIGKMEVLGILMALQFANEAMASGIDGDFHITCDSQYAVNGYNTWLEGWAAKGYHKKGGLANADLWRSIDELKSKIGNRVSVSWVKGHAGDPLNEAADQAANNAARTQKTTDTASALLGNSTSAPAPTSDTLEESDEPASDSAYQFLVAEEEMILQVQMLIQKALNERGISQEQLAEKLGVNESYVSQMFDSSAHNLTLRTFARAMKVLGVKATLTLGE